MKISELYAPNGPFVGQDVYIIGCGPSLGMTPLGYFEGKTCVLLNDTCRYAQTLGPVGFANNKSFYKFATPNIKYRIVKGRLRFDPGAERTDNHVRWDDPDHYVFSYREPIIQDGHGTMHATGDIVSHRDPKTLWQEPDFYWCPAGSSVAVYAVQFAMWAGAKAIHLVGCDCCQLNGEHYTDGKPNKMAMHDYPNYASGLVRMRAEAEKRGIPLLSVTPFMGLGYHVEQFKEWNKSHKTG